VGALDGDRAHWTIHAVRVTIVSMRKSIASVMMAVLVGAPVAARADGSSWGTCLAGPSMQGKDMLSRCQVTGTPAIALAAIAAPVIVAGAAFTIRAELDRRTAELYDDPHVQAAAASGKKPTSLALTPTVSDPYREGPHGEKPRARANPAFEFNDRATNIATAVAGAAVVGAIIATVAAGKH
jgi:hypothetical protein